MHTWYSNERNRRMFKLFLASIPIFTRDGQMTPHFDGLVRDILMNWHPTYHWHGPMIDCATRFGLVGVGLEVEIPASRPLEVIQ